MQTPSILRPGSCFHRLHFTRITHAITAKNLWLTFSTASLSLTGVSGLVAIALSFSEIIHGGLREETPPKFSHSLATAWIIWLTSATAFDLILTVVLVRKLMEYREWITQPSMKTCLRRLMALAIQCVHSVKI